LNGLNVYFCVFFCFDIIILSHYGGDAGKKLISEAGVLVNAMVIPKPHPDVYREVL